MNSPDGQWELALCNAGQLDQMVWLEPWAEEFKIPPRGELVLEIEGDSGPPASPELDLTNGSLVIYAAGGTRIRVVIDGVAQESASAIIECPGAGLLTTRDFVGLVFAGHPEARPGGIPAPTPKGRVERILSRIGFGKRRRANKNTIQHDLEG